LSEHEAYAGAYAAASVSSSYNVRVGTLEIVSVVIIIIIIISDLGKCVDLCSLEFRVYLYVIK